jgi:predicted DCC family thiol-disulfide oxidoreductase YuxK
LPIVFYDGGCPLCSREIAHYRRVDQANRLCWVDAAHDGETLARHGLTLERAMEELHVLDGAGGWHRGIDAFVLIWENLPAYAWLARIIAVLHLRRPLAFVYRHFARWRYRRRCGEDGCMIDKTIRER